MKLGEIDVVRLNVATLRKDGQTWKMTIPDEFAGPSKPGGPGAPRIDFTARRRSSRSGIFSTARAPHDCLSLITPVGDSTVTNWPSCP